jgi:hypothetical protein
MGYGGIILIPRSPHGKFTIYHHHHHHRRRISIHAALSFSSLILFSASL